MEVKASLVVFLALASHAVAQGVPASVALGEAIVPVHTKAADPDGGAYGIWTAGPNFKASFHDGYAFYPLLGKAYARNLPLVWHTESITAAGQPLTTAGSTPAVAWSDRRFARDLGGVVEAYDIRTEGVEQTFVIARRPEAAGAIVVRARIDTELHASPFEGHGGIAFADDQGKVLVEYGAAFAIDASGRKVDVVTGFDGERLTLTVPAEFAASAAYPLTIDPLTSSTVINTGSGVVEDVAIGAFSNGAGKNTLFALSRYFSVTDLDLYVVACNGDYTSPLLVYSDLDSSWSTVNPSIAACEGPARWVVAFQRDFTSSKMSGIRVYIHDLNAAFNTGTDLIVTLNAGNTHRRAQVGGATGMTGNRALLVWQTDVTATQANTSATDVYGRILDATTKTFTGGAFALHANTAAGMDRENPTVSRAALAGTSWVVAWNEYNTGIPNDDWDLLGNRVTQAGAFASASDVVFDAGKSTFHSIMPKIAGQNGRYVISWSDATSAAALSGLTIYARRFDWAEAAGAATQFPIRQVENVLSGFGVMVNSGAAYDTVSKSHWGLVYRHEHQGVVGSVRVSRLGSTAGAVEKQIAFSNDGTALSSDIAFHTVGTEVFFQVAFKANVVGNGVYGRNFLYQNAGSSLYGTGCGGSITLEAPLAGDEYYSANIAGIKTNTPAALFLSGKTASVALAPIGMPGCWLNVDTSSYIVLNTMSNGSGQATLPLPLPDFPLVTGDIFTQWVWLSPGSNALGVLSSQGVKHMIR